MQQNLKVRTIDVNMGQEDTNLGDIESSIMINSGHGENSGLNASVGQVGRSDWDDTDLRKGHKHAGSGITTNEITLNHQVTILNDQSILSRGKGLSSGLDSLNDAQNEANPGTVKIIVHDGESARDSADIFHSSVETSIVGGIQVFQKTATGEIAQVQDARQMPTDSKEFELKIAFPRQRQVKSSSTGVRSALQKQAISRVNESQITAHSSVRVQDEIASKDKKRPRKRYYNGHGKVPSFLVQPVAKEINRKISRVFSGKTWNRNETHGLPSASRSSAKNLADRRRTTQSGKSSQNPYPSYAIPLNFLSKEAQSQAIIQDDKRPVPMRDLHRTVTNDPIVADHSFASELDIHRFSRPSTKIHVNATHLTLDQDLAVQLAQEGAVLGMTDARNEVESLSKPQEEESDAALLFTMDQYRWAQRQRVYMHKGSIGNNSLGRRIATASAGFKRGDKRSINKSYGDIIQSSYDPTRPSQGDFMMEEAAVSHLMHRATNIPKIHFKLALENDEKSESRETFAAYNTVSKTVLQGPVNRRAHQGSKSVSCVGIKPKILGSSNDLQKMSHIGKYLLNDRDERDDTVPESSLDYIMHLPPHSIVSNPQNTSLVQVDETQNIVRRDIQTATGHHSQLQKREDDSRNKVSKSQLTGARQTNRVSAISKGQKFDTVQHSDFEVRYGSLENPISEYVDRTYVNVNDTSIKVNAPKRTKTATLGPQYSTEDSVVIDDQVEKPVRDKFEYQPQEGELYEADLVFSSGNIYHEAKNPATAKLFTTVRNNMYSSHNQRFQRRQGKERIFGMIKKTQSAYNKTLIAGEEQGHCSGVNDKNAADRLYQNRLRTQRFLQKQEDRYEVIRAKRPLREQAKIEARQKRVQERIAWIEQAKKIVPDRPKVCAHTGEGHHHHHHSDSDSSSDFDRTHALPEVLSNTKGQAMFTPVATSIDQSQFKSKMVSPANEKEFDRGNSGEQQVAGGIIASNVKRVEFDQEALNEIQHQDGVDDILESAPGSVNREVVEQKIDHRQALTVMTRPSVNLQGMTAELLGLTALQTSSISKAALSKTKKLHNRASKKVKIFKELFGLKAISVEQTKALEQIFLGQSRNQSPVLFESPSLSAHAHIAKMLRLVTSDQFVPFKLSHNRPLGAIAKRNKIFGKTEQLGLEDRPDFHAFFVQLCEDPGSHNPKVQRLKFKQFLQDRYSDTVGEKILMFLEQKFQTLFTFDKKGYCNVVMEFLNQGPELYKRLIFNCLSRACPGFICEHDIYALLENFKQRDSYYFYRELITSDDVPREFAAAADDSDDIFFEAFADDVKAVAKALNLKKHLLGIEDTDINAAISNDVRPNQFLDQEEYEEELINQIDFLIGMICNQTSKYQDEIAKILINESKLNNIRTNLIELIQENAIFSKNSGGELASQKTGGHKIQQHTPCLGSSIVTETGKKIPAECCYLTFEDFNKLVIFKNGRHSSFVEDLIDHMTNCLISVHDVEIWCSHLRDINSKATFTGRNIIDYVSQMNLSEYGNTRGLPPPQVQIKKSRLGIKAEGLPHKISTPFSIQDQYNGEDYLGKLMIRKIPKTEQTSKKLDKQKTQIDVIEEQAKTQDGENQDSQRPIDGEECSPTGVSQAPMVLNTFLVTDDNVYKLLEHRQYFGYANFFRVFRIFYKLAASTDDVQNNPFALVLDENSVVRNFESAFGIKNEEIAVRFFKLFIAPLGEQKLYKIDVMRWFFVMHNLCDNANPKKNNNFQKLAFNFFDFDNNGNIGSVDILNLKRSIDSPQTEHVLEVFRQKSIEREFCKQFQKFAAETEHRIEDKHAREHSHNEKINLRPILQKRDSHQTSSQAVDEYRSKKVTLQEESVSKSKQSQNHSDNTEQVGKKDQEKPLTPLDHVPILEDPWNHFIAEVQAIRDFYVNQAVKSQDPKNTNYEFFTQKVYSINFMNHFQNKFGIEAPTFVTYFKKILCYQFPLQDDLKKENGTMFTGFTKEGYELPRETEITPELIEMQKMLMEMSTYPKPPVD